MARALTTSLLARLREAFPEGAPYDREALQSPLMPQAVGHFLTRALRYRAEAEVSAWQRARTSPWLPQDTGAVTEADEALAKALVDDARFPAEAWPVALQQAATFAAAYLARPRRALETFVYQQSDEALPPRVVRRRLSYFAAYPYLREAVEAYLEQRGDPHLERDRFRTVLARVDRHLTEPYDAAQWARLLRPLYDIAGYAFSEGDRNGAGRAVPLPLLRGFFGEKEALEAQQKLAEVSGQSVSGALTESELRAVLSADADALATHSEPPPSASQDALDLPDLAPPSTFPSTPLRPASTQLDLEAAPFQDLEATILRGDDEADASAVREEGEPSFGSWVQPGDFDIDEPTAETQHEAGAASAGDEGADLDMALPTEANDPQPPRAEPNRQPPSSTFGVAVPMLDVEHEPRSERTERAADEERDEQAQQPRWQRFAGANPYAPNYSAYTGEKSERPTQSSAPGTKPLPRWKEYRKRSEGPASDLDRLEFNVLGPLTEGARQTYVQYLFAGRPDAYEATLQRLAQAPDWPAASSVIGEDVFRRFQVNIYSEPAVAFTNQVEARFRTA